MGGCLEGVAPADGGGGAAGAGEGMAHSVPLSKVPRTVVPRHVIAPGREAPCG